MGQYDKVLYDGKQVTRRMRAAVMEWQEALDEAGVRVNLFCYQGSWRPRTPYSGTTHTGAGVSDIGFVGMGDNALTRQVLRIGRDVAKGAIFLRGPLAKYGDFDDWHFHWCDLDTFGMDSNAAWQVAQYRQGYNGLNSGVLDPNPYRPQPMHQFNWTKYKREQSLRQKIRKFGRLAKRYLRRKRDAEKTLASLEKH